MNPLHNIEICLAKLLTLVQEPEQEPEPEPEPKPKSKPTKGKAKANTKAKADPAPAKAKPSASSSGFSITGKTVIITGTIPGHDRKQAQAIVEKHGATVAKSL